MRPGPILSDKAVVLSTSQIVSMHIFGSVFGRPVQVLPTQCPASANRWRKSFAFLPPIPRMPRHLDCLGVRSHEHSARCLGNRPVTLSMRVFLLPGGLLAILAGCGVTGNGVQTVHRGFALGIFLTCK